MNYITDESTKQTLAEKLCKITYQKGLFKVLGNSISSIDNVCEKGYFPKTKSIINIYKHNGEEGFYIDEECLVTALNDTKIDAPPGKAIYEHRNPDNSPLMVLKNRFHVKADGDSLTYGHTDLAIKYNNDLCKELYDERNILEKIKDFFKALFMDNNIEEKSSYGKSFS